MNLGPLKSLVAGLHNSNLERLQRHTHATLSLKGDSLVVSGSQADFASTLQVVSALSKAKVRIRTMFVQVMRLYFFSENMTAYRQRPLDQEVEKVSSVLFREAATALFGLCRVRATCILSEESM